MKLFRHKKDGCLYNLYLVSPMMYTGQWHEAVPYFPGQGRYRKSVNVKDFVPVAERL